MATKQNCLNCTYEPNWEGGTYGCFNGLCKYPIAKRKDRPASLLFFKIEKIYSRDDYHIKIHGIEFKSCPVFKEKENDD